MLKTEHNNFDLIRLIAAMMVIVSHSFALLGLQDDPFLWFGAYDTAGGCGVAIFFVISGYLVSGSVSRRSTTNYVASRALRIIPALAVVTLIETFVIGPFFTALPLSDYFASAATWGHLANPAIFGPLSFGLPGVFDALPFNATNGSLWTLPIECGLYLILPAAAFCGFLTARGAAAAFAGWLAAYLVATGYFGLSFSAQGPEILKGVGAYYALRYGACFFAGACLWANRDAVPLNAGAAIICCALLFAAAHTATASGVYVICLPYLVIFAAVKLPVVSLERIGDLSYGSYLFAFPVQQCLIALFGLGHIGPYRLSLFAIPIVLMLAFISWRFVEEPALRLRGKPSLPHFPHPKSAVIKSESRGP